MPNTWVCCLNATSSQTTGQFDETTFWWKAQGQGQSSNGSNAPSGVGKNDSVYFAVQVDGGTGQVAVSDLRASFGRIPDTGGTVASPFLVDTSGRRMCNATSAIALLNLTGGLSNPPGNNWYAIGPFTISADPGFSGNSQYEFIVTATLSNNNQYGLDPEMDVDNGT